MKIGFIGAGKVGFSLGKYFTEKGINLSGYYSREPASSKDAAEFTSSSHYLVVSELIRDSDVIFLTVPDAELYSATMNVIIADRMQINKKVLSSIIFDKPIGLITIYKVVDAGGHLFYFDRRHSFIFTI